MRRQIPARKCAGYFCGLEGRLKPEQLHVFDRADYRIQRSRALCTLLKSLLVR